MSADVSASIALLPSASTPTSPSSALSSNTALPPSSIRLPSSPLFRLPYDVRLRIYTHALTTTVVTWPRSSSRPVNPYQQRQQVPERLSPLSSPALSPAQTPTSPSSSSSSSPILVSADDLDLAQQQQQQQQPQQHDQQQHHNDQQQQRPQQQNDGQDETERDQGQNGQSSKAKVNIPSSRGKAGADPGDEQASIATALLRTCRTIYIEATDLLYSRNRFVFLHPSDCNMFARVYARGVGRSQLAKVRSASDSGILPPPVTSTGTSTSPLAHVCFRVRDREVGLWTSYLGSTSISRSLRADLPALETLWIFFQTYFWTSLEGDLLDNYPRWKSDPRLRELCHSLCERKTSMTAMNGSGRGAVVVPDNATNNHNHPAHIHQHQQPSHHHHHQQQQQQHQNHTHQNQHHHNVAQPHFHPQHLTHAQAQTVNFPFNPDQHQHQQQQPQSLPNLHPHGNSNSNGPSDANANATADHTLPPFPATYIPITTATSPANQSSQACKQQQQQQQQQHQQPLQPFSPAVRVMCLYKVPRIDIFELLQRHHQQLTWDPAQDTARSRFVRVHGIDVALELLPVDLPYGGAS